MSYLSVPRQAGGHLKNAVLDILVQWSGGEIGGGIAYERIVTLAARSAAPLTEPPDATVADVVDKYLTAKDTEIARLRKALTFYADTNRYQYTGWQGDMNAPSVMSDTGHRARAALKGDT